MIEKPYVVYIHINKINGKKYIGITCQKPEYRWGQQGQGYRECPVFWNAILKYGWDNFDHVIHADNLTKEEACKLEIELIAEMNSNNPLFGYNVAKGGTAPDVELMKQQWLDPEYHEEMCHRMKKSWEDPEKRERRSQAAKERWENAEFKQRITNRVIESCGRSVTCIETGEVFNTLTEAENKIKVSKANICRSIRTGYRCGGYHWKYTDDVS